MNSSSRLLIASSRRRYYHLLRNNDLYPRPYETSIRNSRCFSITNSTSSNNKDPSDSRQDTTHTTATNTTSMSHSPTHSIKYWWVSIQKRSQESSVLVYEILHKIYFPKMKTSLLSLLPSMITNSISSKNQPTQQRLLPSDILVQQAKESNNKIAISILQLQKEYNLYKYHGLQKYIQTKRSSTTTTLQPQPENNTTVAQIAFMITSPMKNELTERLQYTNEQIKKMKPLEASLLLNNNILSQDMEEKLPQLVVEYEKQIQKVAEEEEARKKDKREKVEQLLQQQQHKQEQEQPFETFSKLTIESKQEQQPPLQQPYQLEQPPPPQKEEQGVEHPKEELTEEEIHIQQQTKELQEETDELLKQHFHDNMNSSNDDIMKKNKNIMWYQVVEEVIQEPHEKKSYEILTEKMRAANVEKLKMEEEQQQRQESSNDPATDAAEIKISSMGIFSTIKEAQYVLETKEKFALRDKKEKKKSYKIIPKIIQ